MFAMHCNTDYVVNADKEEKEVENYHGNNETNNVPSMISKE